MPPVRRALVTGAAGFIGRHLVRSLVADGCQVMALCRPGGRIPKFGPGVTVAAAELADYPALVAAIRTAQPEAIFHLAGDTSVRRFAGAWTAVDRAIATNFVGTLNVVRAAAESGAPVARLIRAGGLEEYGDGPAPAHETQREQPTSPYSASQAAATHWCRMLQPHLAFDLVTLRPALIYGPGQRSDFLIPALIVALLRGERFAVSNGRQVRDYLYVDDVVAAFRSAATLDTALSGAVINIASGQQYRIADVVCLVGDKLGRTSLVDVGAAAPRPGDLPNVSGDSTLAARLLGWRPRVALDQGIDATIDSYREATVAVTAR